MKIRRFEKEMLEGKHGYPRQWAMQQQLQVGQFFAADCFVEVTQAHIMCDTESLGLAGIEHLEQLASYSEEERQVAIPTITDPRGMDLMNYRRLNQSEDLAGRERRATTALEAMGIMMTDTCINYQTISPPVFGEHVAFGDTGVVIYSNSVFGARSNFEGGPAALAAALTGRVPSYGYHVDSNRQATQRFKLNFDPKTLTDWGAFGAIVGEFTGDYWEVPIIEGLGDSPTSDQLKHFGAALASHGSVALFHLDEITPEALDFMAVAADLDGQEPISITRDQIRAMYAKADGSIDVDVVVFAAPQLSLFEIQDIARQLDGKQINKGTDLLIATSPEIKSACDRFG
ncbi:MAG: DUF521 domain-containing protein, partial [Gammaproteobacteria bacterium]|nr:DUF521 domain-containing protein [Gammaproteobacteria bacterium]